MLWNTLHYSFPKLSEINIRWAEESENENSLLYPYQRALYSI